MTQFDDVTEKLVELPDKQLLLRLGMTTRGMSGDSEEQTRSASIDSIDFDEYEVTRADENTLNFGQRLFKRLNVASYELLCKDIFDDGETLQQLSEALKDSTAKAAGFLAPVLAANLGLAPAVAAIIAALIVKTIAEPIASEICATWKTSLEASTDAASESQQTG